MGKSQREKGARGERMFSALCQEHGYPTKRGGQLYLKGSVVADVVGLRGIHIECKNVERLNYRAAMEQSAKDAAESGRGEIPILAHKSNKKPWMISMLAEDWFKLYSAWAHTL